jgi:hypothetical protein
MRLPRPAGRIGRSWVWRTDQLETIDTDRRRPGYHVARTTADDAPVQDDEAAAQPASAATMPLSPAASWDSDDAPTVDDGAFWDDESTTAV